MTNRIQLLISSTILLLTSVAVSPLEAQTCLLPPTTITAPTAVCSSIVGLASVPDAGAGATYAWTVTGGTLRGGNGTRNLYFSGTTAPVQLNVTITTAGGCSTGTRSVTINAVPSASITPFSASACPNASGISFTVADAGVGATYEWSALNGTVTAGQGTRTVTVSTGTNGPAQVTVKATNASGCSRQSSRPIMIASQLGITNRIFDTAGGTGSVNLETACTSWTATSSASWLTIGSGSSGAGNGSVGFTVAANTGSDSRAATLLVAGQNISVVQRSVSRADGRSLRISFLAGQQGGEFGHQDGPVATARFGGPSGVAIDAAGNIFIADSRTHVIRRISVDGTVSTFAGSVGSPGSTDGTGSSARFTDPTGLTFDAAGNLYVTEANGIASPEGFQIRRITPAGVVTTIAGAPGIRGGSDGAGTAARFNAPSGAVVDSQRNLFVADQLNFTIRKVTPAGVVSTFAGMAGSQGSLDGTGTAATFLQPFDLAIDTADNLYVADNSTIRRITPASVVTTLAGDPNTSGSADGTGAAAQFSFATGIDIDSGGNLYVTDNFNRTIRRVTQAGVVTTLAGMAGAAGGPVDGTGAAARFGSIIAIARNSAGDFIVPEFGGLIRKVTPAGVVTTLAGIVRDTAAVDGTGPAARMASGPIATDSLGNAFLANGTTIRKITAAGVVTTLAGASGVTGTSDGTGSAARFTLLTDIAVDGADNIYVSDSFAHTIRRITPAGSVTTLAGKANVAGTIDGDLGSAIFNRPGPLAVDSQGNIFVAQTSVIRRITSAGVVSTFAGDPNQGGFADGIGAAARFGTITAMAIDGAGTLYVADSSVGFLVSNNSIRKVAPDGTVTTLAGSPLLFGSADGTGPAARFISPRSMTVDGSGNLFVGDSRTGTIRRMTPAGEVTTVAGVAENIDSVDGEGGFARLGGPAGLAFDRTSGRVYISDSGKISIGTVIPMRGDANGDQRLSVADVFYLINFLFTNGSGPVGSGDANGDGSVSVADVFYLINFLFAGGPAPA